MSKQLIQIHDVPYIYLDDYLFEGELNEVATRIQNIKEQVCAAIDIATLNGAKITPFSQYASIKLKYDHRSRELYLQCFREETKEEMQKRELVSQKRKEAALKSAQKRKEVQKKRELTLLAKLKQKYEVEDV